MKTLRVARRKTYNYTKLIERNERFFGGRNNPTTIASKHYKGFADRFYSENAKALEEARLEQIKIKKKKISRINWEALAEGKCPKCATKLLEKKDRKIFICSNEACRIFGSKRFVIRTEKLRKKYLT